MTSPSPSTSLFQHALAATARYAGLVWHEAGCLAGGRYRRPWRRLGFDLAALPLMGLLQLAHWSCLWLDELLFPGLRRVEIRRPVFIVGPPRSGTTHLHRTLSGDRARFSTASTWEVFLAPSILQKKLLRGLRAADRRCGGPLARLAGFCESRLLGGFDEIHPSSLARPEEDYFYLSSLHACGGWSLAFPHWPALWRLMPGVADDPAARRRALDFYCRCLRRQQYVDGTDRVILSKNASFSSWMDLLPETFPDARFVVCMRKASETVPSMLSTADRALDGFAATPAGVDAVHARLVDAMKAHYRALTRAASALPATRLAVVDIAELKSDLPGVLRRLSGFLDIEFSKDFSGGVDALGRASRRHRSRHRYSAGDYRLNPEVLDRECPVPPSTLRRTA